MKACIVWTDVIGASPLPHWTAFTLQECGLNVGGGLPPMRPFQPAQNPQPQKSPEPVGAFHSTQMLNAGTPAG